MKIKIAILFIISISTLCSCIPKDYYNTRIKSDNKVGSLLISLDLKNLSDSLIQDTLNISFKLRNISENSISINKNNIIKTYQPTEGVINLVILKGNNRFYERLLIRESVPEKITLKKEGYLGFEKKIDFRTLTKNNLFDKDSMFESGSYEVYGEYVYKGDTIQSNKLEIFFIGR